MIIERVSRLAAAALANLDFSVNVSEMAVPPFDGPRLATVITLPAYEKVYPRDEALYDKANPGDRMIAIATVAGTIAGYIAVSRVWNECAEIEDIMISRDYRGSGIGRALMDEAVSWARENDLSILRLETQNTNVPACRFYERYGFKLGGFDRYLYDALTLNQPNQQPEIALFWYLHL